MVSPVQASNGYAMPNVPSSSAALQAQVARYQQELSDCVNCETAKTQHGKANIEAIQTKIRTAMERLDAIDTARSAAKSKSQSGEKTATQEPPRTQSANATLGQTIDVFV